MDGSTRSNVGDLSRTIDIRRFKRSVLGSYDPEAEICRVVAGEPDTLTAAQLLDRFSIYVTLLRSAERRVGSRVSGAKPPARRSP